MLGLAALLILAALGAVFAVSVTVLRAWHEEHHFWWGLGVVLAGWLLEPAHPDVAIALEAAGLAIVADDAVQHCIQAWQQLRRGRVTFYSPLYRAYVAVAQWLDRRGIRWERVMLTVRVLVILAFFWLLTGCAGSGGSAAAGVPSRALPVAQVPIEVENRAFEDVVVYVVADPGGTPYRAGRARGLTTTILLLPRSYAGRQVQFAIRFLDGSILRAEPLLLPDAGVTVTVDRAIAMPAPRA